MNLNEHVHNPEEDKKKVATYKCRECGKSFYITAGEKSFYEEHNLNLPHRCYVCRKKNKVSKENVSEK